MPSCPGESVVVTPQYKSKYQSLLVDDTVDRDLYMEFGYGFGKAVWSICGGSVGSRMVMSSRIVGMRQSACPAKVTDSLKLWRGSLRYTYNVDSPPDPT